MVMDPDADPWLARDKLHHILFCFSLTILFSLLASRTPHAFIRNRNILLGSLISLLADAAKEIADHLGFFQSAGASAKDAVAVAAPNPTRLSNIAGFPLFDWSNFGEFGAPRSPFPSDKRHNELGMGKKGNHMLKNGGNLTLISHHEDVACQIGTLHNKKRNKDRRSFWGIPSYEYIEHDSCPYSNPCQLSYLQDIHKHFRQLPVTIECSKGNRDGWIEMGTRDVTSGEDDNHDSKSS